MKITIQSDQDYTAVEQLAADIKYQYDSLIKVHQWDDFEIEIKPGILNCTLCYDKTFHFYYSIAPLKF